MNREGLFVSERINEVTRMCDREHPIYEQFSNFSVALYVLGYLKCSELLFADDIDEIEAGAILKENFTKVGRKKIPSDYNICELHEKYLLVIGDPLFPSHFAVVAYMQRQRPYFSKIKFYGSGFDSLAEIEKEFLGKDGIGPDDVHYFKMNPPELKDKIHSKKKVLHENIYTFKDDGNYNVFKYQIKIR